VSVLYILLPIALLITGAALAAFIWSVRGGQLDDLETPPRRLLFDDDRSTSDGPHDADA